MVKGKFVLLSILAAALLCWQFMPINTNTASSGIVDPCSSLAEFCQAGSRCLIICPQGDGTLLSTENNEICVTVRDDNGLPIAGILANDFWLIPCGTDPYYLCGGSGSIAADAATDVYGQTTIGGVPAMGGCLTGLHVVVQGVLIGCPATCLTIDLRSSDMDGTGNVGAGNFGRFGLAYPSTIKPYDSCCDFDCDSDVELNDFSTFAQHWQHHC